MSKTIELEPVGTPVPLTAVPEHIRVSTGINAAGELITLWVSEQSRDEILGYFKDDAGARFAKTEVDFTYTGRVAIVSVNGVRYCDLPSLNFAFPRVQSLPGGEILAVSARCRRWEDGTHQLNARIYRPDGFIRSEFCLGDGIEHIQTDVSGRIWVGYFDEGVYGNNGWGTSSDNPPIGALGLVCFNSDGQKLWEYSPPEGFDYISDCYVLNCADDAVWACTYTDFPLIRIDRNFRAQAWNSEVSGPRQIAVDRDALLAYGGYGAKANDCWLLRFSDSLVKRVSLVRLILPDSVNLEQSTVIGRGKFLNVIANDFWYRFKALR